MPRERVDSELYGEGLLGSLAEQRTGELNNRFMIPPFSVLNAREGFWQNRKRAWLALGIKSELGRGDDGSGGSLSLPVVGGQGLSMTHALMAKANHAAPGGAAMPAMNYRNRQRGTGTAIAGTEAGQSRPAPPQAPPARLSVKLISNDAPPRRIYASPVSAPASQAAPLYAPASTWAPPAEFPSLKGARRIALDVETRDPDLKTKGPGFRRGAYVVGIAVGIDGAGRYYFPVRHEGGDNLDPERVLGWARAELNAYGGEVVGTNLGYDLDGLANEGIALGNVKAFHDVQVCEPLLDEWRRSYSLESLAQDYLGAGKNETMLTDAARAHGYDPKNELWRLPARFVGPYAEADVDLPLRIFPLQYAKLEQEELLRVYEVERKLIPILVAMRRRGIRIDLARAETLHAELTAKRDEWLAELKRLAGPQAELMSPESFADALQQRGLRPPATAKTGKPSVTAGWLESHDDDPLCHAINEGRGVNTIVTTFLEGTILGSHVNGRVHCTFNQLRSDAGGAVSGRLSTSHPSSQNIPKRDKALAPLIRSLFLPDDGEEWESQDQSQMEYRYLTHFAVGPGADEARAKYAGDPNTDFHAMVAEWLGIDPTDDVLRVRVKGINFGRVYGAGVRKLAFLLKCAEEEAANFARRYDNELPFVKSTFEKAKEWADRQGFVRDILGRKERFPFWEPRGSYGGQAKMLPREQAEQEYGQDLQRAETYTSLNKKLQGSNASHTKKAMVDCWEAGVYRALGPPLMSIHDDSGLSVPRTPEAREAAAESKRITETCIPLRVPVIVKCKRGPNWGAAS